MTEDSNRDPAVLDQIEELLAAYADAHLAPSSPVLARMRRHVLQGVPTAPGVAGPAVARSKAPWWSVPSLRVPRKAAALGLAATLTLGSAAAVLAAPPGSPLYDARVAFESAFLPSEADARLAAHEDHLAQRLAEAQSAAASGDPAALRAALAAYQSEVDAALADAGEDSARLAHLESVLGEHVVILTALEATITDTSAVENALDNSQKAVDKIQAKGSHGGGRPSSPPDVPQNR
jgi:hypothetical protein